MIGRRVYRAPGIAIVPGWICVVVFFLVGVVTATGSPGDPGKGGTIGVVLGVAVGVLAALFSLWMGAVLATNSLIVTSAGLIHRHNLRQRLIGWPEVESFTVGPGRRRMRWPTLIVRLNDGSRVFTSVASYTTGYPGRVARELTELQASAAAAAVTSQDTGAGHLVGDLHVGGTGGDQERRADVAQFVCGVLDDAVLVGRGVAVGGLQITAPHRVPR